MTSLANKFTAGAAIIGLSVVATPEADATINTITISSAADLPAAETVNENAVYDHFGWDTNTPVTATFTLFTDVAPVFVGPDSLQFIYDTTAFSGGTLTIGAEEFVIVVADPITLIDAPGHSAFDLDMSSFSSPSGSDANVVFSNALLFGGPEALTNGTIAGLVDGINDNGLESSGFSTSLNWDGITLSNLEFENVSYTASAVPEPSTYAALFGAAALGLVLLRRPGKVSAPGVKTDYVSEFSHS